MCSSDLFGPPLLAAAERFGYSRYCPSTAWAEIAGESDRVLPGALDAALASYAGRRGADVIDEARALVAALDPGRVPGEAYILRL